MTNQTELHIVTFNMHKGFGATKKRFNLAGMRQALRALDCDVVFLQEVQGEHSLHQQKIATWPEASQFDYLADQLWPHVAYGKNAIYDAGHHGNAILSKHPIIDWENVNLSERSNFSRSLLHGTLQLPHSTRKLHTICFHFGLREKERQRQTQLLNEHVLAKIDPADPLIIAGDSNDLKRRLHRYLHADLNLHEAHFKTTGAFARTFPALFPLLTLDRVYYRGLEPLVVKCLNGAPWNKLSDHLPLYTSFAITN